MAITHIFFDLHGTLVDGIKLHPCYSVVMGRLLAERYGGEPEKWAESNRKIVADWDSYYADLDLGGDDGIAHMYEGFFRTTRAMFRLTHIPEPPKDELIRASRELPGLITRECDGFYPDSTKSVLKRLFDEGYVLGVVSHALIEQARGTLIGGGVYAYFKGAIISPENTGTYNKDVTFLRYAPQMSGVAPENCLIVDDRLHTVQAAKSLNMQAIQIKRDNTIQPSHDVITSPEQIAGWLAENTY